MIHQSMFYEGLNIVIQLALIEHELELHNSAYMWVFFNKYLVQYYMIWSWLNLKFQNLGYREPLVKLSQDFPLHEGQ